MEQLNKIWLLPLLENPYKEVASDIKLFLSRFNFYVDPDQFTLKEIVLLGLKSHSGYWIKFAVSWLNQDFPIDTEIINAINDLNKSKDGNQKDRQNAFIIARKWEKSNLKNNKQKQREQVSGQSK